jgi:preprotein translocase subunit Sec63
MVYETLFMKLYILFLIPIFFVQMTSFAGEYISNIEDLEKLNYYQLLGVSEDATSREIRSAFLLASRKWHTDKHPEKELAHVVFIRIKQAYDVLYDPEKREQYDLDRTDPCEKICLYFLYNFFCRGYGECGF